jgi:hypothetical protein
MNFDRIGHYQQEIKKITVLKIIVRMKLISHKPKFQVMKF